MRSICFVVAVLLACACGQVNGGGIQGGCISSTTWQSASRTLDLGVNDSTTDGYRGSLKLAQSFLVPGSAGSTTNVTSVSLPLYNNGSLVGTTTLTLRLDNSGVPGTIVNGSTVTLQSNLVNATSPTQITFSFGSAIGLSTGTTYWIVLDASYGQTSAPVIKWAADDSNVHSGAYSSGKAEFESSPNVFSTGVTIGQGRELGFNFAC